MRIALSNRQRPMLEMFDAVPFVSVEHAAGMSQVTFGSLYRRRKDDNDDPKVQLVAYKPGKGFHITAQGRDALYSRGAYEADITRKNTSDPLTRFFDPVAYGLAPREKATRAAKSPARANNNVREFSKSA